MFLHLNFSCLWDPLCCFLFLKLGKLIQIRTVTFNLVLEYLLEISLFSFKPHFIQVSIHHFQVIDFLVYHTHPIPLLWQHLQVVIFRRILAFLLLSLHFHIYSLLISCHRESLPCRVLLVPCRGAVHSCRELWVHLLHLILHPVLLPRMYRIHYLHSILLVPYVNLPSLPGLPLSPGHLLVHPVWLRFLPLLIHLITNSHEFIIVS
jgi:hypothetical protein